jgi:putative transposase
MVMLIAGGSLSTGSHDPTVAHLMPSGPSTIFKTLKYQPRFPQRFETIEDARNFCRLFFNWYNQDHHHAGIGLMTPDQVHFGRVDAVHAARQVALDRAFAEYPARFVNKAPVPFAKPTATWINRPAPNAVTECRPQP